MTRFHGLVLLGGVFSITLLHLAGCSSDENPPPASPPAPPYARSTGLSQVCERGERVTTVPETCNGAAALCGRTYDRVVVPMTHNAYSRVSEGYAVANQTEDLAKQLDDGIRGMMLDTAYFDPIEGVDSTVRIGDLSLPDQAFLCHGACTLGRARLLDGLCTITRFLDAHPGEVFSIIFENRLADADTDGILRASGLADYVYTHERQGAPWPTLREMIDTGKRLVVFLEQNGGTPAYLHPAWTNVWDTPYSFPKVEDFSCRLNRGKTEYPLFLMNHWLSPPDATKSPAVNVESILGRRLEQCTQEAGRPPTFVGVDFYQEGDLFSVVRKANGL